MTVRSRRGRWRRIDPLSDRRPAPHGPSPDGPGPTAGHVAVLLQRLRPEAVLPGYARPGDAATDLSSAQDVVIPAGGRVTVGTGIAIALPPGYAGFVQPRSGLAARHGITVLNSPGTVDSGYRGELRVTMINTDPRSDFTVRRGDRIAQLVVQPVPSVRFVEVPDLPETERGTLGFGSSGGFDSAPPGTDGTLAP